MKHHNNPHVYVRTCCRHIQVAEMNAMNCNCMQYQLTGEGCIDMVYVCPMCLDRLENLM